MRVYFLRHADAVDDFDDAARVLSAKGRQQCHAVGRWLKAAGIGFDAAFSSPLVRARETAELVLKAAPLPTGSRLEIVNALLNETSPASFSRWLKTQRDHGHVLLVGHAPTLAEHAAALLGIVRSDALALPKAGLVCIESENGTTGSLKFFITPKFL